MRAEGNSSTTSRPAGTPYANGRSTNDLDGELRARGVSDPHIEAALTATFTEVDESALVRKVIERRMRSLRGPFDARKAASLYRTLLRSGFDSSLIRREMGPALRGGELPAIDPGDEAS